MSGRVRHHVQSDVLEKPFLSGPTHASKHASVCGTIRRGASREKEEKKKDTWRGSEYLHSNAMTMMTWHKRPVRINCRRGTDCNAVSATNHQPTGGSKSVVGDRRARCANASSRATTARSRCKYTVGEVWKWKWKWKPSQRSSTRQIYLG